jgi:hypothetical protein
MQDVHMRLNPGLPCQSSIQQEEESFHLQTGLKCKEETNEMPHLEHSFAGCWNLASSQNRSKIHWKFWNLVLKNVGKDHVDWCEKLRSIRCSQGRKEHLTYNKTKEYLTYNKTKED